MTCILKFTKMYSWHENGDFSWKLWDQLKFYKLQKSLKSYAIYLFYFSKQSWNSELFQVISPAGRRSKITLYNWKPNPCFRKHQKISIHQVSVKISCYQKICITRVVAYVGHCALHPDEAWHFSQNRPLRYAAAGMN